MQEELKPHIICYNEDAIYRKNKQTSLKKRYSLLKRILELKRDKGFENQAKSQV